MGRSKGYPIRRRHTSFSKEYACGRKIARNKYGVSWEEVKAQGEYGKEPSRKCVFNPKFRFLGFAMGRNRKGAYIRAHAKSKKKAKDRLRKLTSRSQGRKLDTVLNNIKVFYSRMAWILRNSWNGRTYGAMEWVVEKKDTNVYLEAVEDAENKSCKLEEIGYVRMAGLLKRKHSKRLLGYCRKRYITSYHYKRKTCTQGLLWYIRSIQVYALNMIESPGTERYARWCERSATQLMSSLLLDFSSCICTIYSCKYIFFVI